MPSGYSEEFPLLGGLGLYASNIEADGNCLFHALSDQIYGNPDQHQAVRAGVIAYMRDNAHYYKQFIEVHPGGGVRRNPKRKNAGTFSSSAMFNGAPSEDEVDRVFESHLQNMAKGGVWGDNMEISAFSAAFNVEVRIYQRDYCVIVSNVEDNNTKKTAHIAYHTWEHYSSIRSLDGPHSGLPNIKVEVLSPEAEQKQKQLLAAAPLIQPWMINNVMQSLPYIASKDIIKRTLEETKGNVNAAVNKLLDEEDRGSSSSTQGSSSVEREPDSDDDAIHGPNKRRERHLNRSAEPSGRRRQSPKSRLLENQLQRLQMLKDMERVQSSSSQESLASIDSQDTDSVQKPRNIHPDPLKSSDIDADESRPASDNDDSAASGRSGRASPQPIRLKINPPKASSDNTKVKLTGKTLQRQIGPQRRKGPSARERKDMKKQAQKLARKERALAEASLSTPRPKGVAMSIRPKGVAVPIRPKAAAAVESGLKTLYI